MHFHLKKGAARKPVLYTPQAAIGVVCNPSLCPAFRVRRGSGREYGSMTSRARRATRPTPSEFRHPPGDGADFSLPASVLGHRSPPASPCALPLTAVELGNPLGVGRGRRQDREMRQGSAGHDGKQRRRARPYDQPIKRDRIQRAPASAGRPIVGDQAQSAKDPHGTHSSHSPSPAGRLRWGKPAHS